MARQLVVGVPQAQGCLGFGPVLPAVSFEIRLCHLLLLRNTDSELSVPPSFGPKSSSEHLRTSTASACNPNRPPIMRAMSQRPADRRRYQFSLSSMFWTLTWVAVYCGTGTAAFESKVLLGAAIWLLGSTAWVFREIYKLEQIMQRRDPTLPPFFQRLRIVVTGPLALGSARRRNSAKTDFRLTHSPAPKRSATLQNWMLASVAGLCVRPGF